MRKQFLLVAFGFSFLFSNKALSYFGEKDLKEKNNKSTIVQSKAAGCKPATAKLFLEFNDVRALIENGGSMFQDRAAGVSSYEIPKVSGNGTKRFAIFAGALWMGGTDINGQLKLAAIRFRQGNDFWSGPLSVTPGSGNFNPLNPQGDDAVKDYGEATITAEQCLAYDKFYTIRKSEVINFNSWFEACNQGLPGVPDLDVSCSDVEIPSNDVLNRIENWPAHGDVNSGQDYYLAPFYDRDADGNYNPLTAGDYPWYDDILGRDDIECGADRRISLFGDETHWWVFNDKGNLHTETQGEPIGMEIRAQAFVFATNDEINRMTFYNYELINRGTQTLYETYFSQFLDADIGNFSDDYAGCDVSRGLGYMYNGDNNDETNGQSAGYGLNPPAIGVDFFEGPYKDPDGKDNGFFPTNLQAAIADEGIVYKGIGIGFGDSIVDNERFGMTRFTYFTGSDAVFPYRDPSTADQYYNFMKGKWANGSNLVYGGLGYVGSSGATSTLSTYMYPGDSDPLGWATNGTYVNDTWDETTSNNPPKDRRFVQSAGPFTLKPGAVNNITVGIVYGRGFDGDILSSVRALKRADTKAQALFDACFKIFDPPMAPKVTIQELDNELIIMLDNPGISHNNYQEKYSVEDEINITIDTLPDGSEPDRFYKFEGYQIYQLKNSSTSISDINDPTKAQLVAQCDIKNGVSRLINFEFDESLGFAVPVEKVNGKNDGIKHTFSVTEDFFALGERTLVNYKTYYYVAISYAYNNFLEYNPNDPLLLGGQQTPYVSSRLGYDGGSISAVSAIPHNPIAEAGGTVQSVNYGSTPRITRLDGTGNGGRNLELTQESSDYIVANGFMENPTYEYGAGPINIKVVDPLNIADGYFECLFDDSGYASTGNNGADSAIWTINHYDRKGGTLIDSKTGSVSILQDNEEVIPEWGISVQINQIKYTGLITAQTTKPITSSVEFADSSKRWLGFINDADGYFFNNWIRSGTSTETDLISSPIYTVPACYNDELNGDVALDEEKLFSSLVGGGVAPYRLTGYQCDFMPFAYYNNPVLTNKFDYIPRTAARLAFLPSVDIVITSDKSKWTRCPVFELGRDSDLNVGNAKSGGLRKSNSVDKNGNDDGTGTGMGWFPGYAIDVETGARLYMAFGENSFLVQDNGADMIWNPTDRFVDINGNAIAGGQHPIYVYSFNNQTINNSSSSYDFPYYREDVNEPYELMKLVESGNSGAERRLYGSMSWIANTILERDKDLLSTDVKIKLRVEKEYKKFVATGSNNGLPMYSWSMNDIYTQTNRDSQLAKVLDIINVVPNPYYAFSEYEPDRLKNVVKITNLPEECTVSIYGVNGKLIRTFKKDSPQTFLDWDLNNHKGVPIASGIYLIHVDIPGVGEKVVKFLGGVRQIDLHGI